MKRNLYIVLIVIAITSIAIPLVSGVFSFCSNADFDFLSEFTTFVTISTTMLSGLCGFATLYIAILLYDRFGMEEKTHEHTIEAINHLIDDMQKLQFIINHKATGPEEFILSLSLQSKRQRIEEHISAESLSSVLYYKQSAMYACSRLVERNSENIYLPKTIAEALKAFDVFLYTESDIQKDVRPLTTICAYSHEINADSETLEGDSCYIPKSEFSVVRFLDAYFAIKQSIIDWYKANGIDLGELNINL